MTSLIVGFKTNLSAYPGFPLNPDTHLPHTAFTGTTSSSSTSTARRACLSAIGWFDDGSLNLRETPSHTVEYIMALVRTFFKKNQRSRAPPETRSYSS
jgi:hypothetical protein